MFFETVFPNANLKSSKLQEHFDRCPGEAIMKNISELIEPVLILEQPFLCEVSYVLANHCRWPHIK